VLPTLRTGDTNQVELYIADPFADDRWDDFVAGHPKASAFHRSGWLRALSRTYDYEPFILTSTPAGKPFVDGVVLCRVASWITGTRAVSLPFTDHCEPLLNDPDDCQVFAKRMREECDCQKWKYVELRPLSWPEDVDSPFRPSASYCFHELDLTGTLEAIFHGLHKNSIQRKIRRAESEGLSYESGRSDLLREEFYRLLMITRRRHRLLPQPRAWFKNLVECMGDNIQFRIARKNKIAIAAMLTLRHRATVVYKYGCSDQNFHALGGMPFLFWKLIEESKAAGATVIDFGRSDRDHESLITFKSKFGATKKTLTYYRYPAVEKGTASTGLGVRLARRGFSILPDIVSSNAGRMLYRHMG
jgi:hypothetical protein